MSRTAIRMLVGALLAVAVLAGCSVRPGAAAVVDGRVISQDELAGAYEELGPLLGGQSSPAELLTWLVVEPIVVQAAEDNGVGVSVDETRKALESAATADGVSEAPSYGDAAVTAARFSLAYGALQKLPNASDVLRGVTDQIAKQDVVINPLYGTWDAGNITPSTFPWIAGSATK